MKPIPYLLLCACFLVHSATHTYGQSPSGMKQLSQNGYVQLSGLIFTLGEIRGDNSPVNGNHLQLALGTRISPHWGLGLGAATWGLTHQAHRKTRFTGFGPHIRYIAPHWIAHFEVGVLTTYNQLVMENLDESDTYALAHPLQVPFFRQQLGIRFLPGCIAGFSLSYIPVARLDGVRTTFTSNGDVFSALSQRPQHVWGAQAFVGVLLQKKADKQD